MKRATKAPTMRLLSCGHQGLTSKRNTWCDACKTRRRVVATSYPQNEEDSDGDENQMAR
jgi:hypothetical protein